MLAVILVVFQLLGCKLKGRETMYSLVIRVQPLCTKDSQINHKALFSSMDRGRTRRNPLRAVKVEMGVLMNIRPKTRLNTNKSTSLQDQMAANRIKPR